MITIVLVDDHKILRQGLKSLLRYEPDFEVIAEAASGEEGLEFVAKLKPDILISDLIMSGIDGIEVTAEVNKISPSTKTIILSMHYDSGYISRAIETGARGYIVKGSGIDELVTGIRQVCDGKIFLSREIVNTVNIVNN